MVRAHRDGGLLRDPVRGLPVLRVPADFRVPHALHVLHLNLRDEHHLPSGSNQSVEPVGPLARFLSCFLFLLRTERLLLGNARERLQVERDFGQDEALSGFSADATRWGVLLPGICCVGGFGNTDAHTGRSDLFDSQQRVDYLSDGAVRANLVLLLPSGRAA